MENYIYERVPDSGVRNTESILLRALNEEASGFAVDSPDPPEED